jgi:tellurite methyltransferase
MTFTDYDTPLVNHVDTRWSRHLDARKGREANPILVDLIENQLAANAAGIAVDLGTGDGVDALYLAKRGWNVCAVDSDPHVLFNVLPAIEEACVKLSGKVETCPYDLRRLPSNIINDADLVMDFASLTHLTPDAHAHAMQVLHGMKPGAIFTSVMLGGETRFTGGQVPNGKTLIKDMAEIEEMLAGFEILHCEEVAPHPVKDADGKIDHAFRVIARRLG